MRWIVPGLIAVLAFVVAPWPVDAQAAPLGLWEGVSELRTTTYQAGVPVYLQLAADGSVTGTVGDAPIRNGRWRENQTIGRRLLGLGTSHYVEGDLHAAIDEAQGLRRDRLRLPLDHVDGRLVGDINLTGGGGPFISLRVRLARLPTP